LDSRQETLLTETKTFITGSTAKEIGEHEIVLIGQAEDRDTFEDREDPLEK
jgi:hypothetical protein